MYLSFKSLVDIHTEWAVLSFNISGIGKKRVTKDNFPQHHKNSPPPMCRYSKHCCLVGKRVEPWFHLVRNYYLHVWEVFNNNSQCDSSLLWVVKPAISLPSCPLLQSAKKLYPLSLSFIKYIFQEYESSYKIPDYQGIKWCKDLLLGICKTETPQILYFMCPLCPWLTDKKRET